MRSRDPAGPMLFGVVDVTAFFAGWLLFAVSLYDADTLDLTMLVGALLVPSAAAYWFGHHWFQGHRINAMNTTRTTTTGALLGTAVAACLALALAATARDGAVSLALLPPTLFSTLWSLTKFIAFFAAAGAITMLVLHALNLLVLRSIARGEA